MTHWLQITIGPLISIVAIFISNWLGRKSVKNNYQLETKDKAYTHYYIPLIKMLVRANKNSLTYYWLVAAWYGAPEAVKRKNDPINDLLISNVKYLPPEIVNLVSEYSVATSGARMFFGPNSYRENYRKQLIKASNLFDEIINKSLKEASKTSETLGYPDIAKPILESFESMERTEHNHPRYLPEIYQKEQPRQFVGEEPPYY